MPILGLRKLLAGRQHMRQQTTQAAIYQTMLRREAELGGKLFGPIPKDHRREFFCLNETTWVWHEEWKDKNGDYQHRTTRYDVRPHGVLKAQDGFGYQQLGPGEAANLYQAVELYRDHVLVPLYGHVMTQPGATTFNSTR